MQREEERPNYETKREPGWQIERERQTSKETKSREKKVIKRDKERIKKERVSYSLQAAFSEVSLCLPALFFF